MGTSQRSEDAKFPIRDAWGYTPRAFVRMSKEGVAGGGICKVKNLRELERWDFRSCDEIERLAGVGG